MDMINSTTKLLGNEDMSHIDGGIDSGIQLDYEDSSSGYDSADQSDSDSVTSWDSSGNSCTNQKPVKRQDEEVMNFRSTGSLCTSLGLILQMPDLCDVTFLVGPRETPVHGVRAILGTRSCVFYQLILKHQMQMKAGKQSKKKVADSSARLVSEKVVIPVRKYDSEVFRMLIEFVHCGAVNISEDTVTGLYCGARQFRLGDLEAACLDFVDRCLAAGRTSTLLTAARKYSHHSYSQKIFDKMYEVLDRRYANRGYAKMTV